MLTYRRRLINVVFGSQIDRASVPDFVSASADARPGLTHW
jgi:hypothetical protein